MRSLRPFFDALTAPAAPLWFGLILLVVLSAGISVPQVPEEELARAVSPAVRQVVVPLGLNDVLRSWPFEFTAALMLLSVAGRGLRRWVESQRAATADGDVAGATAASLGADAQRIGGALGKGWSVRAREATRGPRTEGWLLLALGTTVLLVGSLQAPLSARIRVLDGDDAVARAHFLAERIERGHRVRWDPGFTLGCRARIAHAPESSPLDCRLTIGASPFDASVEPGRDLELPECGPGAAPCRVTLIGVDRATDVAGATLTLSALYPVHPAAPVVVTTPVGVGDVIDLNASGAIVTATIAGGDPLALVPTDGPLPKISARVTPRAEYWFAVRSTAPDPWVATALVLLALGAALLAVAPSYRVRWRPHLKTLEVSGFGALANPTRVETALREALARGTPPA